MKAQPGNVVIDIKVKRYTADDAEEMIGQIDGMPIPPNSLLPVDFRVYRVMQPTTTGRPVPPERKLPYSQNGKNWKLVYDGYDTKTQPMPANMELIDGGQRTQ